MHPGDRYPDGSCNAEVFCSEKSVKLENLGPLKSMEPELNASLSETWELINTRNVEFLPLEIRVEKNKLTKFYCWRIMHFQCVQQHWEGKIGL